MQTQMNTSTVYDALRALGPVDLQDVSPSLVQRLMGPNMSAEQVKATIVGFSAQANEGSREDFAAAAVKSDGVFVLRGAAELPPVNACCGHTWEITGCTVGT